METETDLSGQPDQVDPCDLHSPGLDGADPSGGWRGRGLESPQQAKAKSEEDEGRERPAEDVRGPETAEESRSTLAMTGPLRDMRVARYPIIV